MKTNKTKWWLLHFVTDSNGEPSSMRLTLLVITVFICMMLWGSYQYIVAAVNGKLVIDWLGLSAFIGALTSLIGLVVFQKVQQSKIENKENLGGDKNVS
jgi:TRAP-type C4-dicarboxylate transport system permease small subunit